MLHVASPFTRVHANDIMQNSRRTLILTGASRGIGHATVKRFSSAGWRVLTCSRQPFPEDCPWEAGPEDHVVIDLADRDSTMAGIQELKERLGDAPLNALVNNAGISPKGPQGERLGVMDTDVATWDHTFQVNLFASVMLARGLVEKLKQGKGCVLNVTSIAGSRVHPFAGAAYATSKAALAALTREMAADLGPLGIRVNAIAPGEIVTEMVSPGTDRLVEEIPLRRLGHAEEVASTIYFLCSSQSSYVTGTEVEINGGQHV
jgi:NAD(P)-dependent dehydrogenase (short-subunit alcohol dehydrogenase family)